MSKETLRQVLEGYICNGQCDTCADNDQGNCVNGMTFAEILDIMEETKPDIRKHGYWIMTENDHRRVDADCSVCKYTVFDAPTFKHRVHLNYCPCCGARMDGDRK